MRGRFHIPAKKTFPFPSAFRHAGPRILSVISSSKQCKGKNKRRQVYEVCKIFASDIRTKSVISWEGSQPPLEVLWTPRAPIRPSLKITEYINIYPNSPSGSLACLCNECWSFRTKDREKQDDGRQGNICWNCSSWWKNTGVLLL